MDVINKSTARSFSKLINAVHTLSHSVRIRIAKTGLAIRNASNGHKPWMIIPHYVKSVVAVLVIVFLMTLASINSELLPSSNQSVANTETVGISEVTGYEGQNIQSLRQVYAPVESSSIEEVALPESSVDTSDSEMFVNDAVINEEFTHPDTFLTAADTDNETISFATVNSDIFNVPEVDDASSTAVNEMTANSLPIQEELLPESLAAATATTTVSPPSEDPALESLLEKEKAVIIPNVISHFSQQVTRKTLTRNVGGSISKTSGGNAGEQSSTMSTGIYHWPANGTLTSDFGHRNTTVGSTNHKGIDVAASADTPIYASDGGKVIFSDRNGAYGNEIEIRHDNGDVTLYAHCNSLLVGVGERVSQGQQIACMGSTGNASGVHVHFELRINGEQVDPELYLQ